jgi:hypothetical protein
VKPTEDISHIPVLEATIVFYVGSEFGENKVTATEWVELSGGDAVGGGTVSRQPFDAMRIAISVFDELRRRWGAAPHQPDRHLQVTLTFRGARYQVPGSLDVTTRFAVPDNITGLHAVEAAIRAFDEARQRLGWPAKSIPSLGIK